VAAAGIRRKTKIYFSGAIRASRKQSTVWNETIVVDCKMELLEWVGTCRAFLKRKIRIFAFANNHYAGHCPATVPLFLRLFEKDKI
jgi:hypothetical protein